MLQNASFHQGLHYSCGQQTVQTVSKSVSKLRRFASALSILGRLCFYGLGKYVLYGMNPSHLTQHDRPYINNADAIQ